MLKRLIRSQLRRNVLSGALTTGAQVAMFAIAYPVYLHFLGYEIYGLWLVSATVLSLSQLGNFGVREALMKFVAEHDPQEEPARIQEYASTALVLLAAVGALIVAVVTLARGPIVSAFGLSGEPARIAVWLIPLVAVLSAYLLLVEALYGVLSGLGRMDQANYAKLLGRITGLVVSIVALQAGRGVESLLLGQSIGWLLTHAIVAVCIRRVVGRRLFSRGSVSRKKVMDLVGFGAPLAGSGLLYLFVGPFNKLMISRFLGLAAVPVFEIAQRGAMELRGVLVNGLNALMPEISASSARGAWDRIRLINARSLRLIGLAGGVLYLPVLLAASFLLHIWLGSRYVEPLAEIFRILFFSSFVSLVGVPAYYTLMGMGRAHQCMISHVIQAALSIVIVLGTMWSAFTLTLPVFALSVGFGHLFSTLYLMWQTGRALPAMSA